LEGLALVASAHNAWESAVQLNATAQALREVTGTPLPPADKLEYDGQIAALRRQFTPESFARAWRAGQAMPLEQVLADTALPL
jgi:hypothetical protein